MLYSDRPAPRQNHPPVTLYVRPQFAPSPLPPKVIPDGWMADIEYLLTIAPHSSKNNVCITLIHDQRWFIKSTLLQQYKITIKS